MRYVIAVLSLFLLGFGGVRVTSLQPSNAVVSTSSTPTLGTAWRDQEVTTLFTHGEIKLRLTGSGNGLFFNVGVASPGAVRAGIISGGTEFLTYVQDTPSSCITNWPTTGAHTFTFGVQGFTVYLKIDGVQAIDTCQITTLNPTGAINYYEYRLPAMGNGQPSVAVTTGSASATFTYFSYTALRSNYASGQFDPRDFGMRAIGAVTGSMSAASPTLNLNSAVDIRVGDTVIVEIGGESGAGARNTVGVGGTTPVLNYANATARDADHSQPNGTYAYIQTDGSVYQYSTGTTTWTAADLGGTYYVGVKNPVSLVAKVTAVNGSPATQLTLNASSSVATTNANVYLDSLPSFYPMTTVPAQMFANRDDGLPQYQNMTISVPTGTWYMSDKATAFSDSNGARSGLTVLGQGQSSTILQSPKGAQSELFDGNTLNSNVSFHDFRYNGNHGDNGYMFAFTGANRDFNGYPGAIFGGTTASNMLAYNITCVNNWNGCPTFGGTNPVVHDVTVTLQSGQYAYMGWQVQLANCTGGSISNSTVTGAFLIKAFEMFACNGASIHDVTGTNALFSTNSSTSWTIQDITDTITANSFFSANSGSIDEAIINVNDNAFGSGSTGTIAFTKNGTGITQSGYIDASNNSLKFIQISTPQTNVTITGGFPGGGGCSTTLPGLFSAPNYDAGSAEFGSMLVMSDGASTSVSGIRIKGTAIGTPGHSGHFGNISLLGATSSATNNVADVIQTGPTQSGNQTNAAYGGC